jgi:hypothetical protein
MQLESFYQNIRIYILIFLHQDQAPNITGQVISKVLCIRFLYGVFPLTLSGKR